MKIGFVGCGAIGSCYASYLSREHGIPTPCNDLMLQLVLAKQSIYLGR